MRRGCVLLITGEMVNSGSLGLYVVWLCVFAHLSWERGLLDGLDDLYDGRLLWRGVRIGLCPPSCTSWSCTAAHAFPNDPLVRCASWRQDPHPDRPRSSVSSSMRLRCVGSCRSCSPLRVPSTLPAVAKAEPRRRDPHAADAAEQQRRATQRKAEWEAVTEAARIEVGAEPEHDYEPGGDRGWFCRRP